MKTSPFRSARLLLPLLLLLPAQLFALSEAEAQAGREIVRRYADVVVGVEMVVTVKMNVGERSLPPRERKIEVYGTVIDASGLTVTSLTAIDPKAQMEAMFGGNPLMGKMEITDTDYKEVKLRVGHNTELAARVVLKDSDLDLAFIAPEPTTAGPKPSFTALNLADAAEGVLLDQYFSLSRAPKALQRTPLIRPSLMVGKVARPRQMFLMNDEHLGCPVFDLRGKVLGICLQSISGGRGSSPIVLPAADVADGAKQALLEAAKPPAPKPTPAPSAADKPAAEVKPAPAAKSPEPSVPAVPAKS